MDDAIRRLIELHSDRAYGIALKLSGNPSDAGDLVQEAFLRVIKYMRAYDSSLPFEAWLYQIIRNMYLTRLGLEARRKTTSLSDAGDEDSIALEEVLADPAPGPERLAEAASDAAAVQAALGALSPTLRMAVILVDLEGMPREDCARTLGCSLSALDVRLHRGRAMLHGKLKHLREAKS